MYHKGKRDKLRINTQDDIRTKEKTKMINENDEYTEERWGIEEDDGNPFDMTDEAFEEWCEL